MNKTNKRIYFSLLGFTVIGVGIFIGRFFSEKKETIQEQEKVFYSLQNTSKKSIDDIAPKAVTHKVHKKPKVKYAKLKFRRKLAKKIKKALPFLGEDKKIKVSRVKKVDLKMKGRIISAYKGIVTIKDKATGIKSSFEAYISKSGKIIKSWNATKFEFPTKVTHVRLKVE